MAIPSEKSEGIEEVLKTLNPTGIDRRTAIEQNVCAWCGKPASEFRDELSRHEFTISGFCQGCQDEAFKEPEEDERDD